MIDRNMRARALFHAEALDRRSHERGWHGGVLKRTGLAVYKALLGYACAGGGFCCPAYETIAKAAGVARSTVSEALRRLEAAGLVERVRRQVGTIRSSNAYAFLTLGEPGAGAPGENPRILASSGYQPVRTNYQKTNPENARSVPPAPQRPADLSREEARLGLERAKAAILRRAREREERERRERLTRLRGAPAATAA